MTLYRLRRLPTDWIGIRLYSPPHPRGLTSVCVRVCVHECVCAGVTLEGPVLYCPLGDQWHSLLWVHRLCLPVWKFAVSPPPASPSSCETPFKGWFWIFPPVGCEQLPADGSSFLIWVWCFLAWPSMRFPLWLLGDEEKQARWVHLSAISKHKPKKSRNQIYLVDG